MDKRLFILKPPSTQHTNRAANATLAGSSSSLDTWKTQMDGVNPSQFNNEVIRTDFHQKTVRNEVEVLAEDMTTARLTLGCLWFIYKFLA